MWSLRWHFTNKSVTGAANSIKGYSYSLSHSRTLWWRVRWLKQCRLISRISRSSFILDTKPQTDRSLRVQSDRFVDTYLRVVKVVGPWIKLVASVGHTHRVNSDFSESMVMARSPFCRYNVTRCVEDLLRCSKITLNQLIYDNVPVITSLPIQPRI